GRRATGPSQHRDLAKEMADAKPDVLAVEIDVDLPASDEIHRMGVVAAAHDEFSSLDRLCSQEPHDVGDRRGIEPSEQGHSCDHAPSHHEITTVDLLRKGGRDYADRQRDHDEPP